MQDKVDSLAATAEKAVSVAQTQADLKRLHTEFLGRKGEITALLKGLGVLPKEDRPAAGQSVNKLKNIVQELIDKRLEQVKALDQEARLQVRSPDPTEPGERPERGSLHPLTIVREELEDIFSSIGYMVLDIL